MPTTERKVTSERTNLELAIAVLCEVRDTIGMNVSTNKPFNAYISPEAKAAAARRRETIIDNLHALRGSNGFPMRIGMTKGNIVAYGETVMGGHAGDCFELACAAASCLEKSVERPPWNIVGLVGGNHAFLVISPPETGVGNLYPIDFSEWPVDSAICDPWLDIAVKARDYVDYYQSRLQNLTNIGIKFLGLRTATVSPMTAFNQLSLPKKATVLI